MGFRKNGPRFRTALYTVFEKQGFPIVMSACVALIVLSAIWSGRLSRTVPVPTPPLAQSQMAADLIQQSLAEAASAAPEDTPQPVIWQQPLEQLIVINAFDNARLKRSASSGIWQVHDAVDLQGTYGEPVVAIHDGIVTACSQDSVFGAYVTVDHGDGVSALYASLDRTGAVRTGDRVQAGQVLGFLGNSMLDENDLAPHLHLRVTRSGRSIDPLLLLQP